MMPFVSVQVGTFLDGGLAFNLVTLLLAILGVLVSVVGFATAIWQLVPTRKAAEAAKVAADETLDRVRVVAAMADVAQVAEWPQVANVHLENDAPGVAGFVCQQIFDRITVLKARQQSGGPPLDKN